jgi:hypothetical protein
MVFDADYCYVLCCMLHLFLIPIPILIDIVPVGDHLEVTILPLGIVVQTAPGEVKHEDAERVALAAISRYQQRQYEAAQARAS